MLLTTRTKLVRTKLVLLAGGSAKSALVRRRLGVLRRRALPWRRRRHGSVPERLAAWRARGPGESLHAAAGKCGGAGVHRDEPRGRAGNPGGRQGEAAAGSSPGRLESQTAAGACGHHGAPCRPGGAVRVRRALGRARRRRHGCSGSCPPHPSSCPRLGRRPPVPRPIFDQYAVAAACAWATSRVSGGHGRRRAGRVRPATGDGGGGGGVRHGRRHGRCCVRHGRYQARCCVHCRHQVGAVQRHAVPRQRPSPTRRVLCLRSWPFCACVREPGTVAHRRSAHQPLHLTVQ